MKKVIAEVIDTAQEFKWRLVKGKETSDWSKYYEGILTHKFRNGETWAYCTDYWNGVLPTEKPFQILITE